LSQLNDKENLRQHYRAIRGSISKDQRHAAAEQAVNIFAALPDINKIQKIACYLSHRNEFATSPIIEFIWQNQKECYLPVLHGSLLNFQSYTANNQLKENKYGIKEPLDTQIIATELLDLVFVPLIAFDTQGHRLGAGGGFYDKSFAFIKDKSERRPLLVGLGFSDQQAENLPVDSWDVHLDAVLTEKGWLNCAS
jgi:5-formyltetrahydrofolate cyclo-ligase